jgi:hypothetical protein
MYIFPMHDIEENRYLDSDRIVGLAEKGELRLLYIHRDVRDVVVSLANKLATTFEESIDMVDWALKTYAWLRPHMGEDWVLVHRYDEFTEDVGASVRNIASFLGLEPSEEAIQQIAEACSIEKAEEVTKRLRRQLVVSQVHGTDFEDTLLPRERARALANSADSFEVMEKFGFIDGETLLHYNHISRSRGKSGTWRTALSQAEIDHVHERYGAWIEECGYRRAGE